MVHWARFTGRGSQEQVFLGHILAGYVSLGHVSLGHILLGHMLLGYVLLRYVLLGRALTSSHQSRDTEAEELIDIFGFGSI